jgi:hypothetical protein
MIEQCLAFGRGQFGDQQQVDLLQQWAIDFWGGIF